MSTACGSSAHKVRPFEGPAAGRPRRLQQDERRHEEDRPGRHGEAGSVQSGRRRAAPGKRRLRGGREHVR